jgi:hypothetical protein
MNLDNDLNQPFVLVNNLNENIHDQILDENNENLKERLKFIKNILLYRIPILILADSFYANSNHFYNLFENYNFVDNSIALFLFFRLFILIGKCVKPNLIY